MGAVAAAIGDGVFGDHHDDAEAQRPALADPLAVAHPPARLRGERLLVAPVRRWIGGVWRWIAGIRRWIAGVRRWIAAGIDARRRIRIALEPAAPLRPSTDQLLDLLPLLVAEEQVRPLQRAGPVPDEPDAVVPAVVLI